MCDGRQIPFVPCLLNGFQRGNGYAQRDLDGEKIRWPLSAAAAEIGLRCIGYRQQIATMIRMLMTAEPAVDDGPGRRPLILRIAQTSVLNPQQVRTQHFLCCVLTPLRGVMTSLYGLLLPGLSCMLKEEGAEPTKGGRLKEVDARLDLLIIIVSRPDF